MTKFLPCATCGDDHTYRPAPTRARKCNHCGKSHGVAASGHGTFIVVRGRPGRNRFKGPLAQNSNNQGRRRTKNRSWKGLTQQTY